MGQTMTSKILARASGLGVVVAGDVVLAKVEMLSSLDGTTFIEMFREHGRKVWDPQRVMFCFDHFFQPDWFPQVASKEHGKIRAFAAEQGIPAAHVFDIGRNGISHQVPVEEGWALPGTVCVGVDTQFATVGAANNLALPLLYASGAVLLTGDVWMVVPEVIRVNLTGIDSARCIRKGYRLPFTARSRHRCEWPRDRVYRSRD